MADNLSDFSENLLLKWLLTTSAATRPTTWFVALSTAATTDAGGITEPSTGGYARQAVTFSVTTDTASNTAIIDFVSSADWANITNIAVFDAVTAGNMLFHGALTSARDPASGDTIRIAAGALTLTLQ
jgi:hypothetical protein